MSPHKASKPRVDVCTRWGLGVALCTVLIIAFPRPCMAQDADADCVDDSVSNRPTIYNSSENASDGDGIGGVSNISDCQKTIDLLSQPWDPVASDQGTYFGVIPYAEDFLAPSEGCTSSLSITFWGLIDNNPPEGQFMDILFEIYTDDPLAHLPFQSVGGHYSWLWGILEPLSDPIFPTYRWTTNMFFLPTPGEIYWLSITFHTNNWRPALSASAGDGSQDGFAISFPPDYEWVSSYETNVTSPEGVDLLIQCSCLDTDCDTVCPPLDCAPTESSVWELPGEVTDLVLTQDSGTTTLSWSPPADLGGLAAAYDVVSSSQADDFTTTTCVESDSTDTVATEMSVLDPGEVRYFLILPGNTCGHDTGGVGSGGQPRNAAPCP